LWSGGSSGDPTADVDAADGVPADRVVLAALSRLLPRVR
jgi:hypothetical protein